MAPVTIAVFVLGAALVALVSLFVSAPLFRPPVPVVPADPGAQGIGGGSRDDASALRGAGAGGDGGARTGGQGVITIDQFRELELKVGTVTSAEPHPNADRLARVACEPG